MKEQCALEKIPEKSRETFRKHQCRSWTRSVGAVLTGSLAILAVMASSPANAFNGHGGSHGGSHGGAHFSGGSHFGGGASGLAHSSGAYNGSTSRSYGHSYGRGGSGFHGYRGYSGRGHYGHGGYGYGHGYYGRPYGRFGASFGFFSGYDAAWPFLGLAAWDMADYSYLTDDELRSQQAALVTATSAPLSEPITWNDGSNSGSVTPLREGHTPDGLTCRQFEQRIVVDGRAQQATGTACRQADGSWQIVN